MDIKVLIGVVMIIVIVAVGIAVFGGHNAAPGKQTSSTVYNSGSGNQTTSTNSSKILLSNTQYFPYAYQVYPGPTSPQAQAALAGFNLSSTTLQNGTTKVTVTLVGTSQYQSFMLRPDYKLYIIETSMGDDNFHFDSSLGDDGFVAVDPNGYVAQ